MSSVPLVTIKYDVLYDIFIPLWGREALYIAVRIFYFFSTLLNKFTMKMLPALTSLFLGYLKGSLKNLPRISDYWMLNLLCISVRKPFDSMFNSSSLLLGLVLWPSVVTFIHIQDRPTCIFSTVYFCYS